MSAIDVMDALATGDGVADDLACINRAFAAGKAQSRAVRFPDRPFAVSGPILNEGVSFYGEGRLGPRIMALGAFDCMTYRPTSNSDFFHAHNIMFVPGASGKRSVLFDWQNVTNANNWRFSHVYCATGGDASVRSINTSNLQGVPFGGRIDGGYLAEGFEGIGLGDSFLFDGTVIRSSLGSGRPGLLIDPINGAANVKVRDCNIAADGAAVKVLSGRNVQIEGGDIEQMSGGTALNPLPAVVDFSGATSPLVSCGIRGTAIGIGSTNGVQAYVNAAVRFDNCRQCFEEGGTYTSGVAVPSAIQITANAQDTSVCPRELSVEFGRFGQAFDNQGVATRGVEILLTPISPLSNVGAGYQELGCIKQPNGRVDLFGWVQGVTSSSPQQLCVLPVGFRPAKARRLYVNANFNGSIQFGVLDIFSSGVVQIGGMLGPGQWSFDGLSFQTPSYVVGHL